MRDFADGVLLAAERGRAGQRYVLCAHNPTLKDLVAEIAAVAGTRARTWHLPRWLSRLLIAALVFWSRIRGKEPPPVSPTIAKLIGRCGWYVAPPNARRPRLATAAPARDPGQHGALVSGAPLGSAPFTGAQEVKA